MSGEQDKGVCHISTQTKKKKGKIPFSDPSLTLTLTVTLGPNHSDTIRLLAIAVHTLSLTHQHYTTSNDMKTHN